MVWYIYKLEKTRRSVPYLDEHTATAHRVSPSSPFPEVVETDSATEMSQFITSYQVNSWTSQLSGP